MGSFTGDIDAWNHLGRELAEVDPRRFDELLALARKVRNAHLDPMRTPLGADVCVPPHVDAEDTDRSG